MVNWYPGHMAKARRQIAELERTIDVILEICDCRAPFFTRPSLGGNDEKTVAVMNKRDLVRDTSGIKGIMVSCANGQMSNRDRTMVIKAIEEIAQNKRERNERKGMKKAIKIMVVGLPNVGKSAFINCFARKSNLQVSNRAGVTRSLNWLRVDGYELLDTPGILEPKFADGLAGYVPAWLGCIKDDVLDLVDVASALCDYMQDVTNSPKKAIDLANGYEILLKNGKERGCLISGGEVDDLRTAKLILREFRNGVLDRAII